MKKSIKKILLSTTLLATSLPFLAISCAKKEDNKTEDADYKKIISESKIANNYKEELNKLLGKYEKEKADKNENYKTTWNEIKRLVSKAIYELYQNKYTSMIPVFSAIENFINDKSIESLTNSKNETIKKLQSNPFIDLRDRVKDLTALANKYLDALKIYLKSNNYSVKEINRLENKGYAFSNNQRAIYFKELTKDQNNKIVFAFNNEIKSILNVEINGTLSKGYLKTEIELLKAKNKQITDAIINDYKDVKKVKTYTLITSSKTLENSETSNDQNKIKLSELIDKAQLENNVLLIKDFSDLKLENISNELFFYYLSPISIENNKLNIANELLTTNNPFLNLDENLQKISSGLFRLYYLIPKDQLSEVNKFLETINSQKESEEYQWFTNAYNQVSNTNYIENAIQNQLINNISGVLSNFNNIDKKVLPNVKDAISQTIFNGVLLHDNALTDLLKKYGEFTSLFGDLFAKKSEEILKGKLSKSNFVLADVIAETTQEIKAEIIKLSNREIKANKLKLFTLAFDNKTLNVVKYEDSLRNLTDSKLTEQDGKFVLALDQESQITLEFPEKQSITKDQNIKSDLSLEFKNNAMQTIEKDLVASDIYSNAIIYNKFETIDDEGDVEETNNANANESSNADSEASNSINLSSLYNAQFFESKSLAYLSHIKVKYIVAQRNENSLKIIAIYELPFKYNEQTQNYEKETTYLISEDPALTIDRNTAGIPNELGIYLSINKDKVEKLKDFLSKNTW